MPDKNIPELKKNVVAIGRLLWEKELASALNGNISTRVDKDRILLTATKTCLGLLHDKDVLLMTTAGQILDEGEISSEQPLHTAIYKNFPEVNAVIHTHTVFTNAYFLENETFGPRIFEARFWFGELKAVAQTTPTVTDVGPVIEALRKNGIAVMRNHGVVAMGKDLFSCFLLIQTLEEALQTEAMARIFKPQGAGRRSQGANQKSKQNAIKDEKKYKLFSKEQIHEIVRVINADKQLREMGLKTHMTMNLAVRLAEDGKVHSFHFTNGKITRTGADSGVEFVLTASEKIWRQVFNREIDPFVATTQKKIILKGDFAKLSKWYGPFQRVFALWQQAPVE